MMICKNGQMQEVLDWFEKDHGNEDFWDVDMMLSWVGSDERILKHPGLPAFIGLWCDSYLPLYCVFVHEFVHKWPGVQPLFDELAKHSVFNVEKECWEIYSC